MSSYEPTGFLYKTGKRFLLRDLMGARVKLEEARREQAELMRCIDKHTSALAEAVQVGFSAAMTARKCGVDVTFTSP